MSGWFARPVLFVSDIDRAVDFYVKQLGFVHSWRHEEEGRPLVAQVDREGCALIMSSQWPDKVGKGLMFISSSQWPDKVGKGLMFISLDPEVLDAVRAEYEARGVDVQDGQWGYRLMVIRGPDGNELYFNYPADDSR